MADEVKAMDANTPDPFDPKRLQAAGESMWRGPTSDELIRRFTDDAQTWAAGLHSIQLAVYGMDPGPRERAEKVLAELLSCHSAARHGRSSF